MDEIIRYHGLYAPFFMNNFCYVLTLPESNEVMVVQNGQTLSKYTLEYETI